jgi:hypothetical protein
LTNPERFGSNQTLTIQEADVPSVTLAESAKLSQDDLVIGLIESIVTVDKFFQAVPFDGLEGNAIAYNRELTLGTVATVAAGDNIGPNVSAGLNQAERLAAKDAATFTQVTSALTTIMGDAEVNQLIQQTRSDKNDQTGIQIASKAKSAGRKYQNLLINGVAGANNEFAGLLTLVPAAQKVPTVAATANGESLSLELLDALLDLPLDKDGTVDYILMPRRTLRSYYALLRALGGTTIGDAITLPDGTEMPAYRGTPIFVNDYIPTNQVKGASAAVCTTIFAGTFDDGSRTMGVAGLTATNKMGLHVEDVGIHHERDERIWRVKWYCGLALFSELGIASADGVLN